MLCYKCDKEFPNSMIIDGIKREFYTRKYCLDCVPFGSHKSPFPPKQKTESQIQAKKERDLVAVKKRRLVLKEKAVEYLGGSCSICGYNKYIGALEFHHKDPNLKDFAIGNKGYSKSWERIKDELDKCICVCSNCHRELHNELRKNSGWSI